MYVLCSLVQDDEKEITLSDKVREEVMQQSVIYRKEGLTRFQKCVNEAAAEIAIQNPFEKGNKVSFWT